jgi:uncharacterized membrane protein YhaH (DUF805 family)
MNIFNGRIGRKNYFLGLTLFIIGFYALAFGLLYLGAIIGNISGASDLIYVFMGIIYLSIIPFGLYVFSLHIRRLHDQGHSGWWILLAPIVIWLNFFVPGNKGINKYGESPSKEDKFFNVIFGRQKKSNEITN